MVQLSSEAEAAQAIKYLNGQNSATLLQYVQQSRNEAAGVAATIAIFTENMIISKNYTFLNDLIWLLARIDQQAEILHSSLSKLGLT